MDICEHVRQTRELTYGLNMQTHVHIFESSQLEGSYVGDLFIHISMSINTDLHHFKGYIISHSFHV